MRCCVLFSFRCFRPMMLRCAKRRVFLALLYAALFFVKNEAFCESAVRARFGVVGVCSHKSIMLDVAMTTMYRAGYLCPFSGVRLLGTAWGDAPTAGGAGNVAAVAHQWLNAVSNVDYHDARQLLFEGMVPRWPVHNAGAWAAAPFTYEVAERAFFAPVAGDDLGGGAYVVPREQNVADSSWREYSFSSWAMKFNVGVEYRLTEIFSFVVTASYALNFSEIQSPAQKYCFRVQSTPEHYKDIRGNEREFDFVSASFSYSGGVFADMSVRVQAFETASFMLGVEWLPASCLRMYFAAGFRRYVVEALFSGDVSVPGTVGAFSRSFMYEGERCRLLVAQKERALSSVAWPVAFQGGVRLSCGVASLLFYVWYKCFIARL